MSTTTTRRRVDNPAISGPRLIRLLRVGRGETQVDLAKACYVTQPDISLLESRGTASRNLRRRIENHFGRDFDELIEVVDLTEEN